MQILEGSPDSPIPLLCPRHRPPANSLPFLFFSILDKKKEIEDLRGGDIIGWRFEKTPIYYTSMPIGVSVNRVGNHFTPFCMVCMRCISPYSKYITLLLYETYIHPCYSLCFVLSRVILQQNKPVPAASRITVHHMSVLDEGNDYSSVLVPAISSNRTKGKDTKAYGVLN